MKKLITKATIITILSITGLWLLYWTLKQISFKEIIKIFVEGNIYYLILFLFFSSLILTIHTMRWKLIIKSSGRKVSLFRLCMYKICGTGISYITPGAKVGGEPIRAILLEKHGIEFHKGLSTIITDKIIELSVQGVLYVIALFIAIFTIAMPKNMTFLIIIFSILTISLIGYFYYQIFNENNLFLKWFRKLKLNKIKSFQKSEKKIIEFEKIMVKFHKEDSKDFYWSIFLTALTWFLMFGEYIFAAKMIGFTITIQQAFMIITAMGIAYLIPIPMALGVFEAGQMTTFKLLKLNVTAGIGLALVIRARDLMWTILSIPLLLINGIKLKEAKETIKKESKN